MLELAFQPDRSRREPVYRQLEGYLRELIQSRRLGPGERLPASRELAVSLGLSRNTVNQAYQALVDDDLLSSHVGQGTFVTRRPGPALRPVSPAPARGFAWAGLLARRTAGVCLPPAMRAAARRPNARFDFRPGQVDLGTLPDTELRRAFGRAVDQVASLAAFRDPRGWPPLREQIARSLVGRGIRCGPDDVAIVNGAQQALDLAGRVLIDPGDTVVMEQPGYFGAALAFAASEAHLVGVGVDAEGLRTDELARILRARRVKLVYTTPAVQSPTGVVMSDTRRRALLELADEYQVPLFEDDYDCELRYGTPPTPALKTRDAAGQVIYAGTFSKALFAGVRMGYVVAAPPLLLQLVTSRMAADFQTDLLAQAALAELLAGGGLERHVRRVRRIYSARRAVMLEALRTHMPETVRFSEPAGGNAIWIAFPPGIDGVALHAAALEEGIEYARGDLFSLDGSTADHGLLSFAQTGRRQIEQGIERLARLVRREQERARESA
jgi:GntR family transcriptional regulator/MocR family aminotransferase